MPSRPRTILNATVCLLGLGALLLGCGDGDSDDAATSPTSSPATTASTASSDSTATTTAGADDTDGESNGDSDSDSDGTVEELFPDVIGATARLDDDGTWIVDATLSSPYDSEERYADAWRVVGPDGTEYGIRVLTHDHAAEQPFTRSHSGIEIPEDIDVVTVEGRDQVSGWGGETFLLELTR